MAVASDKKTQDHWALRVGEPNSEARTHHGFFNSDIRNLVSKSRGAQALFGFLRAWKMNAALLLLAEVASVALILVERRG